MITTLISHPKEENREEKKLVDHLKNVANACRNKIQSDHLTLDLITHSTLADLIYDIALLHDFGKATDYFQAYIRAPETMKGMEKYKRHSFLSAFTAFFVIREKYQRDLWAYLAFHLIIRHHGDLIDFDLSGIEHLYNKGIIRQQFKRLACRKELQDFYHSHSLPLNISDFIDFDDFDDFVADSDFFIDENLDNESDKIEFFLLANYLFSLLIEKDKADAAGIKDAVYFKNNKTENLCNVSQYVDNLKIQQPKKFSPHIKINQLRADFFEAVTNNQDITPDNHLYTLTAPTGIGKTFACLAVANQLKNQLHQDNTTLIYCLPFTSIIDQNYRVFENILHHHLQEKYRKKPSRYLLKHHQFSGREIINRKLAETKNYSDYFDDKLLFESWQSALIVTTFAQFFHSIFSNKNRNLKKFHNIVNSIIILDEIQNVDPEYYHLMTRIFSLLATKFHCYFLLMTATQPYIFQSQKAVELYPLIPKAAAFNRTQISIALDTITGDEFIQQFRHHFRGKNALVVMNTKGKAVEIFQNLTRLYPDYKLFCLTNYLIPRDKKILIEKIDQLLKNKTPVILVSTQLIEAGVDLSFHDVFRDFAPLDSIIQVAGRCNRHSEYGPLGGKMHLVNMDNHAIYDKQSILVTHRLLKGKKNIESKEFYDISAQYYSHFSPGRKSKQLLSAITDLNFDTDRTDQIPVANFHLIPPNAQINLHLFPTAEDQEIMETFLALKSKIAMIKPANKIKREKLLIQLEKTKKKLAQYQVALYTNDLNSYDGLIQPADIFKKDIYYPYLYISYDNIKYDPEIGFRPKTLEEEIEDGII